MVWYTQTTLTPKVSCKSLAKSSIAQPTCKGSESIKSLEPSCIITTSGWKESITFKSSSSVVEPVRPLTPCHLIKARWDNLKPTLTRWEHGIENGAICEYKNIQKLKHAAQSLNDSKDKIGERLVKRAQEKYRPERPRFWMAGNKIRL